MKARKLPLYLSILAVFVLSWAPALAQTDDPARADKRARLKQTRKLLKSATKATENGEYEKALAELDSVLALDDSNPDAYYYKGVAFTESADTAAAMAVLATGSEMAPLSSRIKLLLSRLLVSQGRAGEAAPLIDKVLAIKPREGEALYIRGLILMEQGDTTAAVASFQKALDVALGQESK